MLAFSFLSGLSLHNAGQVLGCGSDLLQTSRQKWTDTALKRLLCVMTMVIVIIVIVITTIIMSTESLPLCHALGMCSHAVHGAKLGGTWRHRN